MKKPRTFVGLSVCFLLYPLFEFTSSILEFPEIFRLPGVQIIVAQLTLALMAVALIDVLIFSVPAAILQFLLRDKVRALHLVVKRDYSSITSKFGPTDSSVELSNEAT